MAASTSIIDSSTCITHRVLEVSRNCEDWNDTRRRVESTYIREHVRGSADFEFQKFVCASETIRDSQLTSDSCKLLFGGSL